MEFIISEAKDKIKTLYVPHILQQTTKDSSSHSFLCKSLNYCSAKDKFFILLWHVSSVCFRNSNQEITSKMIPATALFIPLLFAQFSRDETVSQNCLSDFVNEWNCANSTWQNINIVQIACVCF